MAEKAWMTIRMDKQEKLFENMKIELNIPDYKNDLGTDLYYDLKGWQYLSYSKRFDRHLDNRTDPKKKEQEIHLTDPFWEDRRLEETWRMIESTITDKAWAELEETDKQGYELPFGDRLNDHLDK